MGLETSGSTRDWAARLRQACVVLRNSSPDLIGALTLVFASGGDDARRAMLRDLSRRMAEEYGLRALPNATANGLSVRICRPER